MSTFEVKGKKCVQVEPEALTMLSEQAMIDIAHLLRPAHLQVNFDLSYFTSLKVLEENFSMDISYTKLVFCPLQSNIIQASVK